MAAMLFGPTPWASPIVAIITASAPTTATGTGSRPSRIAGRMNLTTTASEIARPASDMSPRTRPNTRTSPANRIVSHSMGARRSKSWKE